MNVLIRISFMASLITKVIKQVKRYHSKLNIGFKQGATHIAFSGELKR